MKTNPIQKIFIEFLKKEGVFDAYVRDFRNDRNGFIRPIKSRQNYVYGAFTWTIPTWRKINEKWLVLIKSLEKKDPCDYHTRCHNCGMFVNKELWVKKDDPNKFHALCAGCLSGYDFGD